MSLTTKCPNCHGRGYVELEHFMDCRVCGQPFDMRDLAQVFFHETHAPVVAPTWSGSARVEPVVVSAGQVWEPRGRPEWTGTQLWATRRRVVRVDARRAYTVSSHPDIAAQGRVRAIGLRRLVRGWRYCHNHPGEV